MKELARVTVGLPQVRERLEAVLTKEVAILPQSSAAVADQITLNADKLPHHNVIAQPQFQFLPRALKSVDLQLNVLLERELDKSRKMQELLQGWSASDAESRLLTSSQEFSALISKLDNKYNILNFDQSAFVDRLRKTQTALNEEVSRILLQRFGFKGLTLDTLE